MKLKPIKAWAVFPKGEPLTHYCDFYSTRKKALRRGHEYAWCSECGQGTGEEYEIVKVLIKPL